MKSGDHQMSMSGFDLFNDQQDRFHKALQEYDPHIWFPPLRGNFKQDNPGNWFICFVPPSWGSWKGAYYGIHFGFMYARPRGDLPERFRLVVGVEAPLQGSQRQAFKEEVLTRVRTNRIPLSGFDLQAKVRTKLLEADFIPFGHESWKISLQRYIALQPLVEIIATIIREYYDNGGFYVPIDFP
jgi:hypothetical protein